MTVYPNIRVIDHKLIVMYSLSCRLRKSSWLFENPLRHSRNRPPGNAKWLCSSSFPQSTLMVGKGVCRAWAVCHWVLVIPISGLGWTRAQPRSPCLCGHERPGVEGGRNQNNPWMHFICIFYTVIKYKFLRYKIL